MNFSFFRIGIRPVENRDIANEADQFALCGLRDFGCYFFFGFFEFDEFHLDQLVVCERQVHGADQLRRHAFAPTITSGFK